MKKRNMSINRRLQFAMMVGITIILMAAETIVTATRAVLTGLNVISDVLLNDSIFMIILWGIAGIIMGFILSFILGRYFLKPVNKLVDGLTMLSSGNYKTRIDYKQDGYLSPIYKSFNNLAAELEKTEILRSDFINSFSHEFKTPISSINGLISLIKKGNLSQKKQNEYLDIIAEETNRLSEITTNILNLTKYESQGILTDKTTFNLSEQIRTCVLLLEKKWSAKNLALFIEFDEYNIVGNEDMLKQVWTNILDNAVKFADKGGRLTVRIRCESDTLYTEIENTGSEIKEEDLQRIFNKFYQADSTHTKEGNGIGLSIVKSIVDLHGGNVKVFSENNVTTFIVGLPYQPALNSKNK